MLECSALPPGCDAGCARARRCAVRRTQMYILNLSIQLHTNFFTGATAGFTAARLARAAAGDRGPARDAELKELPAPSD